MEQQQGRISAVAKIRQKEALQRLVQLHEAMGASDKAAGWRQKLNDFDKAQVKLDATAKGK
jgi:hypothetical protein